MAGDVTAAYAYPAAGEAFPHAVAAVGGDVFSYDASGNTVVRPGQELVWDESGRLSAVSTGEGVQSRVYDAEGNVLLQTDPASGATLFLGDTELSIAPGGSVPSVLRTYKLGDVVVAERSVKAGVSGSAVRWLSGDLNSTQDVSVAQSTGEVVRRFVDPFGNPRGKRVAWSSGHGYLNAPESAVTGLTQLGARAYDPVAGRFLSVDPILAPDNPQQNNAYAYAHNSPVTQSDPSGLCGMGRRDFSAHCTASGVPGGGIYLDPPKPPSSSGKGGNSGKGNGGGSASKESGKGKGGGAKKSPTPQAKNQSSVEFPPVPKLEFPKKCGGAGKFRACGRDGYGYIYDNLISESLSAEEVMKVFKNNPAAIFPFPIEGCATLTAGETCHLKAIDLPIVQGEGDVLVSTTSTSVTFTVVSDDYFDPPGSTIEFKAIKYRGTVFLRKTAIVAPGPRDALVQTGIELFKQNEVTWNKQAENLRQLLGESK